jgi:ribonuclease BN (tRNA processing enzyme)
MLQDAIKKKHCTFSEAICVAERYLSNFFLQVNIRMNAKNVLLTHFSQRLPKFIHVPVSSSPCVIAVASDLMQVHLKDFSRLPFLNDPALTSFFGMDQEEDLEMDDSID